MAVKQEYQDYLTSPEWRELRNKVYLRAEGLCELCNNKAAAVHHIRYPKDYKEDNVYNLIAVCKNCHRKLHALPPETEDEIPFYSAGSQFMDHEICPLCSNNNAHPVKAAINRGGKIIVHDSDGDRYLQGSAPGPGVAIWIHFHGECGHTWYKRWQFHKGHTYIDVIEDVEVDPELIETLWRS